MLLPETAARSLRQNPELLHSWIQTLQGGQGNDPIAKIVNPTSGGGQELCYTRRTGGALSLDI